MNFTRTFLTTALMLPAFSSFAALQLQTYNPGEQGIFPVSSTLISGEKHAILVDAQFGVHDGAKLVEMVKQSGKELTAIYISAGDPDYYFGLQPLVEAFPNVPVLASESVVKHIEMTKDAKIGYWGPILAEKAPTKVIVPKVDNRTEFVLDGEKIEIKQLNHPQAYLWLPAQKTILGGVAVMSDMHVWTADSQTKQARMEWVETLDRMADLKPKQVIPGHYGHEIPQGLQAVTFTKEYLVKFEQALDSSTHSSQVIEKMRAIYPTLPDDGSLQLSAEVNMGEKSW
ncbi:Vmh family MBL fold metallo-hydrolase [Vibrio mimicus]|uniref:Vmh family MBL fold metallo-hydrolase n=1 Tax=Vibrio mimicus TaxID=674 RepID=UPI00076B7BC1|nr:Vmh family MBL fold metallo-hydrolase [Vibrio mimicus]